jgi:flagellar motor switch protein FliG
VPPETDAPTRRDLSPIKPTDGSQRAAAVVLTLGPDLAGNVLRYLDERDMRALAVGAKALKQAPDDTLDKALHHFVDAMTGHGTDLVAGDNLLKDMLKSALGEDAAERAFAEERPTAPPNEILGPLAHADPQDLALLLAKEHPQTTALILSAMEPEAAATILQAFPDENRAPILRRIAKVESVAPEVLQDVVDALIDELEGMGSGTGRRQLDGKTAAIELLRRFPGNAQADAMEEIEEEDPELADQLRSKLFTFQDVARLSDRDVQSLLKEVDVAQLTIALKGTTESAKEKIISNMSRRVAQMLLDDLQTMAPVRVSEVEQAQEDIARIALDLAEEGRITVVSGGEEML